jgi:DNA invertase Pin-like site-specific DNA recombinase
LPRLVRLLDRLDRRQALFQSITERIDTSSSGGRLVFHMIAALAEFERALISERTRAGMAAARAAGKQIGRRPSLTPEQCREACRLLNANAWTAQQVASHFHVHPRTLRRSLAPACFDTKISETLDSPPAPLQTKGSLTR